MGSVAVGGSPGSAPRQDPVTATQTDPALRSPATVEEEAATCCSSLDTATAAAAAVVAADDDEILLEEIKKAIDKHMPIKTVKFDKYRHKKETWITSGILKSIRYKDKLYRQLKMTNPFIPQYNILKTNLKTYSTILKRNIRLAKKNALY